MKNNISQNLLRSLLNSDFLLEKSKGLKLKISRYQNIAYPSFIKKESYVYLEPLEIIKDLKQVIRIFQFLNKNSITKSKKLDFFYFVDENSTNFEFLIPKIFNRVKNIDFVCNPHLKKDRVQSKIAIVLNSLQNYDKNLLKNSIQKKCYLYLKINSEIEVLYNEYKLRNNLIEYKKILFFFSFLRQLFLITK